MADTATRPRLAQVFPYGARLDLVPDQAAVIVLTGDPLWDARLALAVLLARHPHPAPSRDPYTYAALDHDGRTVADGGDPAVCALLGRLRGTDLGERAQRAALDAVRAPHRGQAAPDR